MVACKLDTWSKWIVPHGGISFVIFIGKMDRWSIKYVILQWLCVDKSATCQSYGRHCLGLMVDSIVIY
jgi:hypothetical protein